MEMKDMEIGGFVRQLASAAPVPGGGGAAALVAAVGAALGGMVASLTEGKKKYAEVQEEILSLKARCQTLQERFLTLMDRDAEAFAPLAAAYGLPKETEEQRAEKSRVMEAALKEAARVPLELMELCVEALAAAERLAQIGSALAVSDAGVAAVCLRSAAEGASLNVFINTRSMADRELAQEMEQRAQALLEEGRRKGGLVYDLVRQRLN